LNISSKESFLNSKQTLKKLDKAEQLADFGTWEFDLVKDIIWWSPQADRILELNPQEFKVNYESWMLNIFPPYREIADISFQKSITDKTPFDIEYRLITKNDTLKYVRVKCHTYFDENGNPLKCFGIIYDITLLKEKELLLQKEITTKGKLMSVLAHDLRAPFNKILGFTGLLIDNVKGDTFTKAESEKYLNIIYTSSEKTLTLLDNLLNWIRFQVTEITFSPELLSLRDVISDVLELETLLAEAKEINLNDLTAEDIEVYADENMLKIIIRNIIANAIKFTNFGGAIQIDSFLIKDGVEIHIKDNGIGIAPQKIKNIFTATENSRTLGTQNEEGTGKGLSICKEFIDRHKGKIWIESEIGKGSIFKIMLPNKNSLLPNKTSYKLHNKKIFISTLGSIWGFI
jgi:signal transduction histidine kinase